MAAIDHQSLIYSFDVGAMIPRFNDLSDGEQASIEVHIAEVIYESFVEPGDHDYLAARSLAIGGLYRAFFWSASQTVEKYLKAFLLFNGVSAKDVGHDLSKLLKIAGQIEKSFGQIDLAPHPGVRLPLGGVKLTKFNLASYIRELKKLGSTSNRYNNAGAIYDTGHLFALDTLAHHLREKMTIPELRKSFRGRLSEEFSRYLYDNNPYHCPKDFNHTELPSSKFPLVVSMSVPRWEFLKANHNVATYVAKEWLKNMMKIE